MYHVNFSFICLKVIFKGGGGVTTFILFGNRDQNGLNIELDSCNLVHMPSLLGTRSKLKKVHFLKFLG